MSNFVLISFMSSDPANTFHPVQVSTSGFVSLHSGHPHLWQEAVDLFSLSGFLRRTWSWFYQDTTKIISRKRLNIIMLSIDIGSFDCKTSYKYLLPWQHSCEVGKYFCFYISNRNPRLRSRRLCSEPRGQELHGVWVSWSPAWGSYVAGVSINTWLYIV